MSAAAGPRHAMPSSTPLTGVATLLALAARRDRVRLSVWVSALTLLVLYTPFALDLAFPTEADRLTRVELIKTPAGIMMAGPMFGRNEADLGVMVANELMLSLIVAASIMSILTVIRHTRAEEESGAAELVMSSVVGRFARTGAALSLVVAVNAGLAASTTAALAIAGLAVPDSAAMAVGIVAVSLVFGAIAAVAAQLWRQARSATGAAMAVLAAAVLTRGVGDVIDYRGSALSWFSPIAWAQQMRAFVELRWWPLALLLVLTGSLVGTAVKLEGRRQYDSGTLPSRGDHPGAPTLRGVFGLQLFLQRGQLIGWTVGLFLGGLSFGSMTTSVRDALASNEILAQVFTMEGDNGLYTAMTQFLAATAAVFVAATVLRLAADERSGIAEAVLSGALSRTRWLVSTVLASLAGVAVLLLAAGLGNGIGAAVTTGRAATVGLLTGSALAHLPAMAVLAGVAAIAVAVRRPWAAWLAVAFVVLSLYLGPLLRLPQWVLDVSPVLRTTVPSSFPALALAVMVAVAAVLTTAASAVYRSRDAI